MSACTYRCSPDYTLENFLPGNNSTALALALQAAEFPGDMRHNPLVFYGPSGSGKTHLLQGIGNRIRQTRPEMRILYFQTAQFCDELIRSILLGRSAAFRRECLEADVLLMDDVQFLAGKEHIQQEFYLIFSLLYERGCQILLSCDRPVPEILCLEDRMVACFIGGIMQPLTLPDRQTRLSYLQEYAREQQLDLTRESLEFLAVQITGGFPRLRGVVDHLRLQAPCLPFTPDMTTVIKTAAKFHPSGI